MPVRDDGGEGFSYRPGRSSRLSSPAATLTPTCPCRLSGCSAIELFEPPTRTLPGTDTERRTSLRAGVVAGEIAGPEQFHGRKDAPGERGLLGDAEIDADLANGGDITILRPAIDAKYATEIGYGADDEADARPAAAFENADLHEPWLLRMDAGKCTRHGDGDSGEQDETALSRSLF